MEKIMVVKCPQCRKETEFGPGNPHRPFCSERCQILDLGAWADEEYVVPVADSPDPTVNENTGEDAADEDLRPPKHRLN